MTLLQRYSLQYSWGSPDPLFLNDAPALVLTAWAVTWTADTASVTAVLFQASAARTRLKWPRRSRCPDRADQRLFTVGGRLTSRRATSTDGLTAPRKCRQWASVSSSTEWHQCTDKNPHHKTPAEDKIYHATRSLYGKGQNHFTGYNKLTKPLRTICFSMSHIVNCFSCISFILCRIISL